MNRLERVFQIFVVHNGVFSQPPSRKCQGFFSTEEDALEALNSIDASVMLGTKGAAVILPSYRVLS